MIILSEVIFYVFEAEPNKGVALENFFMENVTFSWSHLNSLETTYLKGCFEEEQTGKTN